MSTNLITTSVRFLSAILFLLGLLPSFAQTKTELSQYFQLPFMYNPGLSGMENYTDLKAGYRRQWNNFNKAPKGFFVSGNHQLGNEMQADDVLSKISHGISGYVLTENVAPLQKTELSASYAVHVPLSSLWKLGSGFSVNYNRFKNNSQEWILRDYDDAVYQALQTSGTLSYMTIGWGMTLHTEKLSAGYSVSGLVNKRLGDELSQDVKFPVRHKVFVSYNYMLDHEIELIPTILFQYESPLDPLYSFNIKARYRSSFWAGAGYTPNKALSFLLGASTVKNFNFSYSYDISVGDANNLGAGNHELVIGYVLFNRNQAKGFLW
jgi:type IX secretion system PorP/SprF family membrane protein